MILCQRICLMTRELVLRIVSVSTALSYVPVAATSTRLLRPPLSYPPLVFPANAGSQGPPSTGWRPKGHRATTASAAESVLFFKRARRSCRRRTCGAEVRSVAAAPPRRLGPRLPAAWFHGHTA